MVDVRTDWKSPARQKDAKVAREKVQSEGCRVCGRDGHLRKVERRPYYPNIVTRHHLVPRSLGGDDVLENIVGLCGHGTLGCHGLVEARDLDTCSQLRAALTEPEITYIVGKKGAAFLDRYYPADKLYERSTG